VVLSNRASNGRMDRQSTDGGVWLGANPSLPDPGPRWRLRRDIPASGSIHRDSRSSDVSSLTLSWCSAERHLHHVLLSYMSYYNGTRTHLSLHKDAPISRAPEIVGRILCRPILGRTAPPICPDLICGRHKGCGASSACAKGSWTCWQDAALPRVSRLCAHGIAISATQTDAMTWFGQMLRCRKNARAQINHDGERSQANPL
jgi:hypothetical protein